MLLGEFDKAATVMQSALKLTPLEMGRRRALMITHLANISLRQGHIEECCSYAVEALLLAHPVHSTLVIHRLQKLSIALQPYAKVAAVKQFRLQLAATPK